MELWSYGVKTIQKPCYKSDSLIEDNHTNQKGCALVRCAPFFMWNMAVRAKIFCKI